MFNVGFEKVAGPKEWLRSAGGKAKSAIKNVAQKALRKGKSMVGIKETVPEKAKNMAGKAVDAVKAAPGKAMDAARATGGHLKKHRGDYLRGATALGAMGTAYGVNKKKDKK